MEDNNILSSIFKQPKQPPVDVGQRAKIMKKALEINPKFNPIRDFSADLERKVSEWMGAFKKESPASPTPLNLGPETRAASAGVATPREGSQPSFYKTLKSIDTQRLNVPAQAQALPEFLQQLISPRKEVAPPVGKRDLNLPVEKPIEPVEPAPYSNHRLQDFGSKNPFLDYTGGDYVMDPFGNTFSKGEDGKLNPTVTTFNDSIEQRRFKEHSDYTTELINQNQANRQSVIDQATKTAPLVENDDIKIYALDRRQKAKTKYDLLREENSKRAAFNLSPLTEIPEWIEEMARSQKELNVKTLVAEFKKTGEKTVLTGDDDLNTYSDVVPAHSSVITQQLYPEYFDEKNLPNFAQVERKGVHRDFLGSDTGNVLGSMRLQGYLARNAPREILEKMGITPAEAPPPNERKITGIEQGDEFFNIDQSVYENLTPKRVSEEVVQQVVANPQESNPFQRFNVWSQLKALPEYVAIALDRKNPFIINYGANPKNLPSPQEQAVFIERVKRDISPSIVRVMAPSTSKNKTISIEPFTKELSSKEKVQNETGASGFILNGHVITAKHVINNRKDPFVLMPDGSRHRIIEVYEDPKDDFAILKVEGIEGYKSLIAKPGEDPNANIFRLTTGYPKGEEKFEAFPGVENRRGGEEIVADSLEGFIPQDLNMVQLASRVIGGQSGGPILDTQGNVIGIVSLADKIDGKGSRTFAIPIDLVLNKMGR